MKILYKKRRSLLLSFWILTISVIILSLQSQYLIINALKDVKKDVNLIDAANDQETRTLEIMKQIAADKLEGKDLELPTDSLVYTLKQVQQTILSAKKQSGSPFTKEYQLLDNTFKDFDYLLEAALIDNDNISFVNLMSKQEMYLKQLDKVEADQGDYANNKINKFQFFQALIMLGSLLIIALETVFIVLPAIKKIKKQNEQLSKIAFEQSHIVRRPLANLLGLLHLIKTPESNGAELEEVLRMIKCEAEELDKIIHKTVSFASTEFESKTAALPAADYVI